VDERSTTSAPPRAPPVDGRSVARMPRQRRVYRRRRRRRRRHRAKPRQRNDEERVPRRTETYPSPSTAVQVRFGSGSVRPARLVLAKTTPVEQNKMNGWIRCVSPVDVCCFPSDARRDESNPVVPRVRSVRRRRRRRRRRARFVVRVGRPSGKRTHTPEREPPTERRVAVRFPGLFKGLFLTVYTYTIPFFVWIDRSLSSSNQK
jgi:hypothetical protein